ncbi:MAG: intradiol ring-cleavage dioxygenase [Paracoccus sp. (in: a-proteobacteria)]|uniref:intradiol ring-cleavage dioxygenase n=1 Tax=Paracoccus sp. TaxID=267 RepID=UPI00391AB52C
MTHLNEANSVDVVNARTGPDADPRLAQIVAALVRHLHALVREVEPTETEWSAAIDFLTRTGQISTETRQEFILLSDALGVSMLVDAINNRLPQGATETTVFGPFHVDDAPERPMGALISLDGKGEVCLFHGRVLDLDGQPVEDARVDVWSDNADGFYDVQQPDLQPAWNNRGVFRTGPDGRYAFRGIRPVSYPIPDDGPVGQMLTRLDRHPWRPAHTHFKIDAPGCRTLITHLFVAEDPFLDSDAVFGVKPSLIAGFRAADRPDEVWPDTKWQVQFDFILCRNPA